MSWNSSISRCVKRALYSAPRSVSLEEPGGEDLEVLEVEPRPPLLRRGEPLREEVEEGPDVVVDDAALARLGDGGDRGIDRLAVAGQRLAALLAGLQRGDQVEGLAARRSRRGSRSPARRSRVVLALRLEVGECGLGGGERPPDRAGDVALRRIREDAARRGRGCGARRGPRSRSRAGRRRRRRRRSARARGRRSARNSSSASSKASSATRSDSAASRTRNRGSIPTATGCEARSRLQKPWIVITQALPRPSSSSRARSEPASARSSIAARIRCRSSAAALSVKVKARTESGATPSSQTSRQ